MTRLQKFHAGDDAARSMARGLLLCLAEVCIEMSKTARQKCLDSAFTDAGFDTVIDLVALLCFVYKLMR